jgi:hypothetical protein
MHRIITAISALFAWQPSAYSANLEIQHNSVTGNYRYRRVGHFGGRQTFGRWYLGLPYERFSPVDLDVMPSAAEMAAKIAPRPANDAFG